jgi:predicted RND superfamily exporter protein
VGSSQLRHRNRHWTNLVVASLTQMALARPGIFLSVACVVTILGTAYSAVTLQFRTSRLDLLDTRAEYNQRWLHYLELFGKQDDGIILIEGDDPQSVSKALIDVGTTLEKDKRFSGVLFHSAVPQLAGQRLHLAPTDSLESLSQLLQTATFAVTPTTNTSSIDSPPDNSNKKLTQPVFRPNIAPLVQQWNQLLNAQAVPLLAAELSALDQYLDDSTQPPSAGMWQPFIVATTDNSPTIEQSLLLDDAGRIGLCLMSLRHPDDAPQEAVAEQTALRGQISLFEERYPDLRFYFTGMPVLEADEGQSTQNDMMLASVVSLVGVVIMLIVAYGSLRMPLLAMIALLFGLFWTLTFASVAIGHLNLLSAAFGAILIGLGIDFSIHYLSHFLTAQPTVSTPTMSIRDQLLETSRYCGVGIWVGAISTAAAFACAAVTPFKGISELGIISGGGTLLCAVAALTILPAMLLLYLTKFSKSIAIDAKETQSIENQRSSRIARWLSKLTDFAIAKPTLVLTTTAALICIAAPTAYRSRFDHNLLNLQAKGLSSGTAENILIDRSSHSTWYAISLTDSPQQAEDLANRFRSLPSVARVDHAASLIASQGDESRKALFLELKQQTEPLLLMLRGGYTRHTEIMALQNWLNQSLPRIQGTSLAPVCASLEQTVNRLKPTEFDTRMKQYEIARQGTSIHLLQQLNSLLESAPPTIQNLPPSIRQRLWHDSNIFQLRIFPRGNVWDREPLEQFIKELESVDPKVTGHPVQTFYASGELQESYYSASIYALLVVSILLLLNFGNPLHVITAMLPALCGLISLLALMTWFDVPLNPANMIALPLVLGIGVDDGVHLTEQFRQCRWGVKPIASESSEPDIESLTDAAHLQLLRPTYTIDPGTNLAILLTSVSTMLGFGSLMVAHHRGLFSLGWVLTVGIGLCWLFSVLLLPALFSAIVRWQNNSRKLKRTRRARRAAARDL